MGQAVDDDQYIHRSWTAEQGAPSDVWAITQGPEGLLWLGTGNGLFRFDGIAFESLKDALGIETPSSNVVALGTAPDGAIWAGYYYGGVSVLEKGKLTNYLPGADVPGAAILCFAWEKDGTAWATSWGGLLRFHQGRWQKIDRTWSYPSNRAYFVLAASDGTIWVTTGSELVFLPPGAKKFERSGIAVSEYATLAQSGDGPIWLSDEIHGTHALPVKEFGTSRLAELPAAALHSKRILFDRNGNLWGTLTREGGAYRAANAARFADGRSLTSSDIAESFQNGYGVPSNVNVPIYEDKEGTVWIGSNLGITSFRPKDVKSLRGILIRPDSNFAMAASSKGTVWIANNNRLLQLRSNRYDEVSNQLPNIINATVSQDDAVWLVGSSSLLRWRDDRLEKFAYPSAVSDGNAEALSAGANGELWASFHGSGLFHFGAEGWSRTRVPASIEALTPTALESNGSGTVWAGYPGSVVLRIAGATSQIYSTRDGLDIGTVTVIEQHGDRILAGGEFGVARLRGDRWQSWRADQYDALRGVSGLTETETDLWINGSRGIVRIARDAIDGPHESGDSTLVYRVFDFYDGLPGAASQATGSSTAMVDRAGRIWFETSQGPVWIDPDANHPNKVPPAASILRFSAESKRYPVSDGVELPEGTSNVRVDFAADSLAVPSRVRFRYRLMPLDGEWQEGAQREVGYSNLRPGSYEFEVVAANDKGLWGGTAATLRFVIAPYFFQTRWFFALCVLLLIASVALLFLWRMRLAADKLRDRFEQRTLERENIARDLHDTLIQGMQGLLLRLQTLSSGLQEGDVTREALGEAVDDARDMVIEGRNRITSLRVEEGDPAEFANAIREIGEDLASKHGLASEYQHSGALPPMPADVLHELLDIVREALRNAFMHSAGSLVQTAVFARRRTLTIVVRDNGKGIESKNARQAEQVHFGLIGMRERARKIGAKLTLHSVKGAGTEVRVDVPSCVWRGSSRE